MLLEVKNVEVLYNNIILALKGVSLEVSEGNIVTILGANGAGKTTILKAISGILILENGRVTKGEILFEGRRMDGKDPAEIARSKISLVMEGRELFRTLTVEENLRVGTLIRKDDKKEIRRDLEIILQYFPRLEERKKQIAGTLSGGEQQMLVIARALMTKPKLLLLDEPSLGLAPLVAEMVFTEVKKINKNLNTTILLVEQNAFLALPISQFVYVITNGVVALKSTAEEMKGKEISKYYLGMGS
ncbi:MAG: ABC transporter ATP-binding protein [Deltaproteobacteria bacterium RBG_16_47_11]|jgi:branched-chain amino acid transport system ATP-binding protein|nr:MAG: ABC transporter ATP-binding protein [Deltaproteobacteria bacterium RBG_16_47_11]